MTTPTTIDVHAPTRPTSAETIPTRRVAVVIALLFLGATATFLAGDALVVHAFDGPVTDVDELELGVVLQALNALAVAGIGIGFLRLLPTGVRRLALGHLVLRIVEAVVIIGLGAWMTTTRSLVDYEPVIYLFTGSAGLLLTTALARTGLVERPLVRLGAVGYVAILGALPLQLFTSASLDSLPGLLLYVPGALFELFLPLLLLARGFREPNSIRRARRPAA